MRRCAALLVGLAVAAPLACAFSESDLNGVWQSTCAPCGAFPQCTIETVFVGATKTYSELSTCLAPTGFSYTAGQQGEYIVEGDFLGREVTKYEPKEYLGELQQPPIGGTFRILSLTPTQLTVVDNLSGATLELYKTGGGTTVSGGDGGDGGLGAGGGTNGGGLGTGTGAGGGDGGLGAGSGGVAPLHATPLISLLLTVLGTAILLLYV